MTCRDCKREMDEMDAFPGDRCLPCHKLAVADLPPISAAEMARMFIDGTY